MHSIDLAALRAKLSTSSLLPPEKPVPASKLLYILGPILFNLAKRHANSITVQTMHYVWQKWYLDQPKIIDVDLSIPPNNNYPGACFHCLHTFSHDACVLTTTCGNCHSLESLSLYFFKDMLWYRYKVHPSQIDKLFSELIYYRCHNVRYSESTD